MLQYQRYKRTECVSQPLLLLAFPRFDSFFAGFQLRKEIIYNSLFHFSVTSNSLWKDGFLLMCWADVNLMLSWLLSINENNGGRHFSTRLGITRSGIYSIKLVLFHAFNFEVKIVT